MTNPVRLCVRFAIPFLCSLLVLPISGQVTTGQSATTFRLDDSSDWWSANRSPDADADVDVQKRELPSSNFRVLGVELGEGMFDHAAAKLGKATIVERGDASTGRSQVCYVSTQPGEKVYLIFEQGEVDYSFYLFTGGPSWDGSDWCVHSGLVSHRLATESGLRLGLTPSQAIAILGRPSSRRANELLYSFSLRKKNSPTELRRLRQQHPELSDKDFEEDYGGYDLWVSVRLEFVGSKLSYLGILKSETD